MIRPGGRRYRGLPPGCDAAVAERWDETLALSRVKQTFEYVELRRDPEVHVGDSPAELEALEQIRRAFEARDMRALRQATRRYIRDAPRDEA